MHGASAPAISEGLPSAASPTAGGGSEAPNDASKLLRAIEISKRFPGFLALDCVFSNLKYGEIHGLFGENGAFSL